MSQDGKEVYMEQILKNILNWLASSGVKIVIALVVMWIAFRIINAIFKKLKKKAEKSDKLDKTLGRLLVSGGRILVKILVALALVGYLGIDTSGVAALIASLGVAVGLAVNGALGNVAGGVLLIVTKPFKVDDFIEVAGYTGTVEEINLCATKLVTVDNRVVYVPNGTASTSNIVNYSEKDIRRVDHTFAIAYGSDFEKAKQLLTEVLSRHEKVLADPAPMVRVCTQSGGTVELTCRGWVRSGDYWDVFFDVLEQSKTALEAAGIAMPHQQVDVHIQEKKA